jgi:hypothetical protein
MTGKHIYFEIDTLVTGANRDFAGYVDYQNKQAAEGIATIVGDAKHKPTAGKRPTRLGKPGGHFDGSLDVLAEAGENRYYFRLAADSGTKFAPGEAPIVPIGGAGKLISDIKIWDVANGALTELADVPAGDQSKMLVSFSFDLVAAKASADFDAINKKSDHKTAFKIPFYFNLLDTTIGVPPWAFDDHRYGPKHGLLEHLQTHADEHPHDHDHEDIEGKAREIWKMFPFTHGGIHPRIIKQVLAHLGLSTNAAGDARTHGGIHPPGVASFVIVENP